MSANDYQKYLSSPLFARLSTTKWPIKSNSTGTSWYMRSICQVLNGLINRHGQYSNSYSLAEHTRVNSVTYLDYILKYCSSFLSFELLQYATLDSLWNKQVMFLWTIHASYDLSILKTVLSCFRVIFFRHFLGLSLLNMVIDTTIHLKHIFRWFLFTHILGLRGLKIAYGIQHYLMLQIMPWVNTF
jgi:hypothetical protein